MSLVGMWKGKGESGFGFQSTADEVLEALDLRRKTFLLTGCAGGLGAETMRALVQRGALVIGTARTLAAAQRACSGIAGAVPVECDLSEPGSVRAAIEDVRRAGVRLDGIIANAGVMAPPERIQKHGLELQLLVNHVGHHLLVTRLVDVLAPDGRVVVVSSSAHADARPETLDDLASARGYEPWAAYGRSKLANVLFATELARRLDAPRTANALHPGIVRTQLQRHLSRALRAVYPVLGPLAFKTIPQGAATQCYVAAHPGAAGARGRYFVDCNVATPSRAALAPRVAAGLWDRTEEILARLR